MELHKLLNNDIKKRFVKDNSLPINLIQSPYFEYYIELYDDLFNIEDKLKNLYKVLDNLNSSQDFFDLSSQIKNDIQNDIKKSNFYNDFNNSNLNNMFEKNIISNQIEKQDLYIEENYGKKLISIDLKKANYNILNLFGLNKELNVNSYDELIKKYTNYDYYIKSKIFRQVIFGELNAARQQKIQKLVLQYYKNILDKYNYVVKSNSNDELIIHNINDKNNFDLLKIKKIMEQEVEEKYKFYDINMIEFNKINDNYNYLSKNTYDINGNHKLEIKNTPSIFFAQVYKEYLCQEINDYDLSFYYEGYISQFKEKLFEKKLTPKYKI